MEIIFDPELLKYAPTPHPPGFEGYMADDTAYYYDCMSKTNALYGIRVVLSASIEDDGRVWIHVSLSRPNRIPSFDDLVTIKRLFIGDERYAYQVFPPQDKYYSNPGKKYDGRGQNVLHLWALAEPGLSVTPDFLKARGGMI